MTQQIEHSGHLTRIHIDEHLYESPNPTTGAALYLLGKVHPSFELFKEVDGNREDVAIPNDGQSIDLRRDEHFHSGKSVETVFQIFVNAEQKEVAKKILTFEEIVAIAFPNPPTGPNVVFTVVFKKAVAPTHEGSLLAGSKVEIRNGTIFSVTHTDKS